MRRLIFYGTEASYIAGVSGRAMWATLDGFHQKFQLSDARKLLVKPSDLAPGVQTETSLHHRFSWTESALDRPEPVLGLVQFPLLRRTSFVSVSSLPSYTHL